MASNAPDKPVYTYDTKRNPLGAYLPGIPLRDLTTEDVEPLTPQQKRSVEAAPWYAASAPGKKPKE